MSIKIAGGTNSSMPTTTKADSKKVNGHKVSQKQATNKIEAGIAQVNVFVAKQFLWNERKYFYA